MNLFFSGGGNENVFEVRREVVNILPRFGFFCICTGGGLPTLNRSREAEV